MAADSRGPPPQLHERAEESAAGSQPSPPCGEAQRDEATAPSRLAAATTDDCEADSHCSDSVDDGLPELAVRQRSILKGAAGQQEQQPSGTNLEGDELPVKRAVSWIDFQGRSLAAVKEFTPRWARRCDSAARQQQAAAAHVCMQRQAHCNKNKPPWGSPVFSPRQALTAMPRPAPPLSTAA